jgi:hypothetical protein
MGNRFLFMHIAALRVKQLRLDVKPRVNPGGHRPEWIAEELRRGLVPGQMPDVDDGVDNHDRFSFRPARSSAARDRQMSGQLDALSLTLAVHSSTAATSRGMTV